MSMRRCAAAQLRNLNNSSSSRLNVASALTRNNASPRSISSLSLHTRRALCRCCTARGSASPASLTSTPMRQMSNKKNRQSKQKDQQTTTAQAAAAPHITHFEQRQMDHERLVTEHAWNPHDNSFRPSMSISQFIARYETQLEASGRDNESPRVSLAGRIMRVRQASPKLYFFDLIERGAMIQIMATKSQWSPDEGDNSKFEICSLLQRGDILAVCGIPAKTNKGELSLIPTRILRPLRLCMHQVPMQVSDSNSQANVDARHLGMIVNHAVLGRTLRLRARLLQTLRHELNAREMIEVETPILWRQAGGAMARPFVTQLASHHNTGNSSSNNNIETSHAPQALTNSAATATADDKSLFLRISPELFLKQFVMGTQSSCYELGKVFRNEGLDSTHNVEFTMLEAYVMYSNYRQLQVLLQQLLRACVVSCHADATSSVLRVRRHDAPPLVDDHLSSEEQRRERRAQDVKRHSPDADSIDSSAAVALQDASDAQHTVTIDFSQPFAEIDIIPALEKALNIPQLPDPNDEASIPALLALCREHSIECPRPHTLSRLCDKLIGHFLEPQCVQPTFLIHHPLCMSPLAKQVPADSPNANAHGYAICERFELFVNASELCNAYSELNDAQLQRQRMQHQQSERLTGDEEQTLPDDSYCSALEYGLVHTAGFGIGIDRLLMLLTNQQHIRQVIAFPLRKHAAVTPQQAKLAQQSVATPNVQ